MVSCLLAIPMKPIRVQPHEAAYQVGLSFLTNHMRRAVAACTSPEVFFGYALNTSSAYSGAADALDLAIDSLSVL
jgi:alpha,alpha-trehalase